MSKIAIISQPDRGVTIDVSGCTTLQEASQQLASTLQISSQFWAGHEVEFDLGDLALASEEVAQIIALANEVGIRPARVHSGNQKTQLALQNYYLAQKPILSTARSGFADSQNSSLAVIDIDNSDKQESKSGSVALTVSDTNEKSEPVPVVLFLKQTLRSGQSVQHKGHLVIVGDVNPGAEVMADGDIMVWGALRGIAHAGMAGNAKAEIRALQIQAMQLRIAHCIARAPDRSQTYKTTSKYCGPETAAIKNGAIHITADRPD